MLLGWRLGRLEAFDEVIESVLVVEIAVDFGAGKYGFFGVIVVWLWKWNRWVELRAIAPAGAAAVAVVVVEDCKSKGRSLRS